MKINTPYYLIDERKLLKNLKIIEQVRKLSGAKSLLALKCFAAWSVFDLMSKYMDGTTSSSSYEARLGFEKFGKETHAYCVGYSSSDIDTVVRFADKVIFNSVSQLESFYSKVRTKTLGLRINPGISYSHFDLADPARKFSRLGVADIADIKRVLPMISGGMFHFNCENDDVANFEKNLDYIADKYAFALSRFEWISLGGGLYFSKDGYPVKRFASLLAEFSKRFDLQVYLEPGESAITNSTSLVTSVVDIVRNDMGIAIVDASTEAHMLDLLIYRLNAKVAERKNGKYRYIVAGRSCLAGDVFGTYKFTHRLKPGDIITFNDAGGYTMVKKNWFNGLQMPSIVVKRLDDSIDVVREFHYKDFVNNL